MSAFGWPLNEAMTAFGWPLNEAMSAFGSPLNEATTAFGSPLNERCVSDDEVQDERQERSQMCHKPRVSTRCRNTRREASHPLVGEV